jgi:hypothetical protein
LRLQLLDFSRRGSLLNLPGLVVIVMSEQPADQPGRDFSLECPVTKTQVIITAERQIYIQEKSVFWWHCPACRGWHVEFNGEKLRSNSNSPNG